MVKYQPSKVEEKSRNKWKNEVDLSVPGKKFYLLVEFTYPSGDLHMGHWFAFAVPDILARLKRMQGYTVFAPQGFDAFGLPAENAAIKRGIHPKDWTYDNIARMKKQFASMGAVYDWEHEVITSEPDYYRWNQWIFLKMYEKGLAYKGKTLSNWCPTDQTVLANENVENGKCWRCGSEVIQKEVEQWFLKITEYADRLEWPDGPEVDWPKPLREGQNNWIGKSEGIEISFQVSGIRNQVLGTNRNPKPETRNQIIAYTKFPETIFGVTYMVIAPEHPLVGQLTTDEHKKEVEEYIKTSQKKSELERTSLEKQKTGVFTGSYVVNPVNLQKVPIWVADYVIFTYGTGAVMGVPGSDVRDFAFAKKFGLEIIKVIAKKPDDQSPVETAEDVLEEGWIVNSGQFDGLATPDPAKGKMMEYLSEKDWGKCKVNYHLHDWSVSRQRYWGTPIPVIYCVNCWEVKSEKLKVKSVEGKDYSLIEGDRYAIVPVPEKDLPVELPYDVDFAPRGKPPLATAEDWVRVKCPNCGEEAMRDVETLDTFFDSSWYFLRYLRYVLNTSKKDEKLPFAQDLVAKWMPVDIYFGGAEHTLGHTLYSRFFVKFLKSIGVINIDEYAQRRVHHGVILGPDGQRMSKSHGNVVNPDDEVAKYGADAVRLYLAFLGPYDLVAPWDPGGIRGVYHFLERVWKLFEAVEELSGGYGNEARIVKGKAVNVKDAKRQTLNETSLVTDKRLTIDDLYWMHKTIKKVGEDIEGIKFNTAVAAMMEWLNYLSAKAHRAGPAGSSSHPTSSTKSSSHIGDSSLVGLRALDGTPSVAVTRTEYETFLKLLAPFAPHITEELWEMMQNKKSIHDESWPEYDGRFVKTQVVTLVVQVNGKVRDSLPVKAGIDQKEAEKLALASEKVQRFLGNKPPQKTIFVKDRLINFVA
ncbi:MAG: leucine--tRNA ligase [Candidatus Curtissbacteria bacterium]|nr:leucine--tRNA ligase [Candidatus Curtissbacteria bacterium]